jgi:RES domain-containing protein
MPHVLSWARILDPTEVHVVSPTDIPNPNWLHAGTPSAGQQRFGDTCLGAHLLLLIPSAVSTHSWNLLSNPARAAGRYAFVGQERFALDTRLHPPAP